MPRPAVYLRVSTEQQREKVSISSQEDALTRWLEAQVYDPYEDIIWYRDDGVSGEMPITSRGDGARLVTNIRDGVVGGFVATFSVSRISREASDFFAFRRLLSDHKLVLIGVSEGGPRPATRAATWPSASTRSLPTGRTKRSGKRQKPDWCGPPEKASG